MNELHIDEPAKWKTRILRPKHTADKSLQYTTIFHNMPVCNSGKATVTRMLEMALCLSIEDDDSDNSDKDNGAEDDSLPL